MGLLHGNTGREVVLEMVPQSGFIGHTAVQHWTMRIGSGPLSLYEFERNGFDGPVTVSRCGTQISEVLKLKGLTHRQDDEIARWCVTYARENAYNTFTNNCQDFVYELSGFLGDGFQEQLPMTQRKEAGLKLLATAGLYIVPIALRGVQQSCAAPGGSQPSCPQSASRNVVTI
eukprot:TRINITY_DN62758_c0_g1_i1.p1 TRINITY_DN62758_c0_g1~~TRINITY_DN62758_c0_g1_i1.p1  ORF type:complete len:186 (-),score=9.76 TRINITY_DN62758_c0_g1_i1:439-957(-)